MSQEGHESCVSLEEFKKLQELHDNQKKIIARLQQENQNLKQALNEHER